MDYQSNENYLTLERINQIKNKEEKERALEKYYEIQRNHEKEAREYLNQMNIKHISYIDEEKYRKYDENVLQELLERVRQEKFVMKKEISDDLIKKTFDKNHPLFKEWERLIRYILESKNINNNNNNKAENKVYSHAFNYAKVIHENFKKYNKKLYLKKNSNDNNNNNNNEELPEEFILWIKEQINVGNQSKYSLFRETEKINKQEIINIMNNKKNSKHFINTGSLDKLYNLKKNDNYNLNNNNNINNNDNNDNNNNNNNNSYNFNKNQMPKKKFQKRRVNRPVINKLMTNDILDTNPKLSSSSSSSTVLSEKSEEKKINNLKYFFEMIQKLKNLPPDEYSQRMNNLLDNQLETLESVQIKKHSDRINNFLINLNNIRLSNKNIKNIKSHLKYKNPITIFSNKDELNNNNKYERNIYKLIYDDYKGKA